MAKSRSKSRKVKNKFAKKVLDVGIFLLAVLFITYLLSNFVVERLEVRSVSMEPTLYDEDSILIDKISYRFRKPQRKEIIVFHQNKTGDELIKRVIGLPHETIKIEDGVIYIDGEAFEDIEGLEVPENPGCAAQSITLMDGEYFVLGDNREDSIDSRYEEVGIVSDTRIIGRLMMRILPLSELKTF